MATKTKSASGSASGSAVVSALLLLMSSSPGRVEAYCMHFNVTAAESVVMREFKFTTLDSGCVDAFIYQSDTPPLECCDDLPPPSPGQWTQICAGTIEAMGGGALTTLPESQCQNPFTIHPDEEMYFFLRTVPPADPNLCTGVEYGGIYSEIPGYNIGLGFCPAEPTTHFPTFMPTAHPITPTAHPIAPTDRPTARPVAQVVDETAAPTSSPIKPTPAPIAPTDGPTSPPTTRAPRTMKPSQAPTTYEPTVSLRPTTLRPTREPNTAEPTTNERYTVTATAIGTGEGNADPAYPVTVGIGTTVTVFFYPKVCLEPEDTTEGIMYGHFDSDYFVFPNNDPASPNGYEEWEPILYDPWNKEFSFPTGTDAHDHEYDVDCDCVFVDFFIPTASMDPLDEFIDHSKFFVITLANTNINTAGFLSINKNLVGGFDHNKPHTYIPAPLYDDTHYDNLQVYSLGTHPDKAHVQTLTGLQMGYKKDAIARGMGGILPTNTGDMKGNVPGQHGEWRNGALTMQLVQVDELGNRHCTLRPEWSNSSAPNGPIIDGIQRSTHGPVDWCPLGYTVLYESTLFWHWGGGCVCGGPSYHDEDWPHDYRCFFESDCYSKSVGGTEGDCVPTKLCYILVDGAPQFLPPGQNWVVLERVNEDHNVQGYFVDFWDECPEVPITFAPTISSAPTISHAPTPEPTISRPPSASPVPSAAPTSKFLMDQAATDHLNGACWTHAVSFSCFPSDGDECRVLEGTNHDYVNDPTGLMVNPTAPLVDQTDASDPDEDGNCPDKDLLGNDIDRTWLGLEPAPMDCITFHVDGVPDSNMIGQCPDNTQIVNPIEGKVNTQSTLIMPDGQDYPGGYSVTFEINPSGICSHCYLGGITAYFYDPTKLPDFNQNQCPTDWDAVSVNRAKSQNFGSGLLKKYSFVFKGDTNKNAMSFASYMWCGQFDIDGKNGQGKEVELETGKGKDYNEV